MFGRQVFGNNQALYYISDFIKLSILVLTLKDIMVFAEQALNNVAVVVQKYILGNFLGSKKKEF